MSCSIDTCNAAIFNFNRLWEEDVEKCVGEMKLGRGVGRQEMGVENFSGRDLSQSSYYVAKNRSSHATAFSTEPRRRHLSRLGICRRPWKQKGHMPQVREQLRNGMKIMSRGV